MLQGWVCVMLQGCVRDFTRVGRCDVTGVGVCYITGCVCDVTGVCVCVCDVTGVCA